MPAASPDVTQLLVAWRNGDEGALERLRHAGQRHEFAAPLDAEQRRRLESLCL